MPITQDRMIALINSGLDYKQAYESARASIEQHFSAANAGEEDWIIALHTVWERTKPSVVLQSTNSAVVLAVEHQHFKYFRNRNNYAAKEAKKYRDRLAARVASADITTIPAQPPAQLNTPAAIAARKAAHTATTAQPEPVHAPKGFNQSSDSVQINPDSELDFGPAAVQPTQSVAPAVKGFFDQLDENGNRRSPDLPSKS